MIIQTDWKSVFYWSRWLGSKFFTIYQIKLAHILLVLSVNEKHACSFYSVSCFLFLVFVFSFFVVLPYRIFLEQMAMTIRTLQVFLQLQGHHLMELMTKFYHIKGVARILAFYACLCFLSFCYSLHFQNIKKMSVRVYWLLSELLLF